jgi:hypothetical protein
LWKFKIPARAVVDKRIFNQRFHIFCTKAELFLCQIDMLFMGWGTYYGTAALLAFFKSFA